MPFAEDNPYNSKLALIINPRLNQICTITLNPYISSESSLPAPGAEKRASKTSALRERDADGRRAISVLAARGETGKLCRVLCGVVC